MSEYTFFDEVLPGDAASWPYHPEIDDVQWAASEFGDHEECLETFLEALEDAEHDEVVRCIEKIRAALSKRPGAAPTDVRRVLGLIDLT